MGLRGCFVNIPAVGRLGVSSAWGNLLCDLPHWLTLTSDGAHANLGEWVVLGTNLQAATHGYRELKFVVSLVLSF